MTSNRNDKRTQTFSLIRVGWCSLFFCAICSLLFVSAAHADWSNEILIWESTEELPASSPTVVIAVDSFDHAHIVYSHPFRMPLPPHSIRFALWYRQHDEDGNLVVPDILISDSIDIGSSDPVIRFFGSDSLIVMYSADNIAAVPSVKYTTLTLDGTILQLHRAFPQNHWVADFCFDVTADRRMVLATCNGRHDSIRITVQLPNGERILNESPVWRNSSCYYVIGYVDHTDSLQLAWRQNPSLHTAYGKRISITTPLDTTLLDEYTQLTELNQVAYQLLPVSDSTIALSYGGYLPDSRYAMWINVLNRNDYGLISNDFVGSFFNAVIDEQGHLAGLMQDTVATGTDTLFYWVRSLPDLTVIEKDSITSWPPWYEGGLAPYALGVSHNGVRHIVYSINTPDSFKYVYRYWRSDLSTDHEKPQIIQSNAFRIWPNPTNGGLYIDGPLDHLRKITVYNILGQKFAELSNGNFTETSGGTLDISALPSGYYFFALTTMNREQMIPVIIVR